MKMKEIKGSDFKGYKNGREHLSDELAKLDTMIQLQVLRFRDMNSQKHGNNAGLSGLCIQEEDIDRAMKKKPANPGDSVVRTAIKQIKSLRETISKKAGNSLKQDIYLPLYHLAGIFQLTSFELDIILVCLAPELDIKYEKLYAYLQDDVIKKSPSVNLILDLLCAPQGEERIEARPFFFKQSPLLKYRLVKFSGGDQPKPGPLISRCLKLDDRIVDFLLEQDAMDSTVSSYAEIITPAGDWQSVIMEEKLKKQLSRLAGEYMADRDGRKLIFYLTGPLGVGKKTIAGAFCRQVGLPMIVADTGELQAGGSRANGVGSSVETIVKGLFREALLQPAAIYLEHFDRLISGDPLGAQYQNMIARAVEEFSFITFIAGEKPWSPLASLEKYPIIKIALPTPPFQMRKRLWEIALNGGGPFSSKFDINIDEIADKFQFTGGQIQNAAVEAQSICMMHGSLHKDGLTMADLYHGCRARSNHNLSKMAQKITPHYTWSDIVLPADKLQQLKEMCSYVKYRHIVYNEWGFGRKISLGKGLNILFSGPSGTGKTMASEIIANRLNLDFYKIDLSCVVSKYIGETEKNLAGIFKEAETANAVLFFDEADALFGKRSEVKDSHDRYANIEINYLLQKMEEHEGIVILATNFRKNIDEAFTRRMHFSIEFPFPDEEYRLHIWQKIFPSETPKSKDIDYQFLAKQFKIPGGSIKNIALNAAFLAADNSRNVHMTHIIHAAKREYRKMGKLCTQSDFGKYYHSTVVEPKGGIHE